MRGCLLGLLGLLGWFCLFDCFVFFDFLLRVFASVSSVPLAKVKEMVVFIADTVQCRGVDVETAKLGALVLGWLFLFVLVVCYLLGIVVICLFVVATELCLLFRSQRTSVSIMQYLLVNAVVVFIADAVQCRGVDVDTTELGALIL